MPFPANDKYWVDTVEFLKQHLKELEPVIAHQDFVDMIPGAYPYRCLKYVMDRVEFRWAVIHKGILNEFAPGILEWISAEFAPVFANEVFIILTRDSSVPRLPAGHKHLKPLTPPKTTAILKKFVSAFSRRSTQGGKFDSYAIVVNAYNRPDALERSLPQIVALGAHVLVVDDASLPEHASRHEQIARRHGASYLAFPGNRGLPCSMNMGVTYWLADPDIHWIAILNDDVDVRPDLLEVMSAIQDAKLRPVCTGNDDGEHVACQTLDIGGHSVRMMRFCRGQHIHAHRDYWSRVIPIPTPYLGAPKADRGIKGQGSDSDWWIVASSPESVVKRGMYVACVPGLVSTFLKKASESTWGGAYPGAEADGMDK